MFKAYYSYADNLNAIFVENEIPTYILSVNFSNKEDLKENFPLIKELLSKIEKIISCGDFCYGNVIVSGEEIELNQFFNDNNFYKFFTLRQFDSFIENIKNSLLKKHCDSKDILCVNTRKGQMSWKDFEKSYKYLQKDMLDRFIGEFSILGTNFFACFEKVYFGESSMRCSVTELCVHKFDPTPVKNTKDYSNLLFLMKNNLFAI